MAHNVLTVDIRDKTDFDNGHIDGSVNMTAQQLLEHEFGENSEVVVVCRNGNFSEKIAGQLREKGVDARALEGGYSKWLFDSIDGSDRSREIEQSIRKKFARPIWSRFARAIIKYELVKPGDRIAVCISGGKDSMLLAKLFQELKAHNKFDFEVRFLVMDPGYSPVNRSLIEKNAKILGIPIEIFETNIFNSVFNVRNNPCYLCARMRRGHLYNKAKEMGCNKIALGHHYDDVIETILMGMIYGGQVQTMMPKLHSANFEGMQLIRPMYLIREAEIKRWRDYNDLHFLQCACRFTEQNTSVGQSGESDSKRLEIKHLIAELQKRNPQIEANIFRSVENVNLNTIISYKKNGEITHFLDGYDD
ncbi:MAG: ATPase [Ruminococcus sp.]|nr:ATPase [Ruminococcus sp.]